MVSINQLVDIVEDIAGIALHRTYDLAAPKGVMGRNSDNTLIRRTFGWEPDTRLRDGMAKTYEWIELEWLAKYGPGARAASAPARANGKMNGKAKAGRSKPKAKASGKKKAKSRAR